MYHQASLCSSSYAVTSLASKASSKMHFTAIVPARGSLSNTALSLGLPGSLLFLSPSHFLLLARNPSSLCYFIPHPHSLSLPCIPCLSSSHSPPLFLHPSPLPFSLTPPWAPIPPPPYSSHRPLRSPRGRERADMALLLPLGSDGPVFSP